MDEWYSYRLKQLILMVQQAFKFLDTLCLCTKYKIMSSIGQGHQILRAIVVRYSIKVMDNPAPRKRFFVGLFPNKDMLKNIFVVVDIGFGIVWHIYKDITASILKFTTSPRRAICPAFFREALFLYDFSTRATSLRTTRYSFPTINTIIYSGFGGKPVVNVSCVPENYHCTLFASYNSGVTRLPAINTGMPVPISIGVFCMLFHTLSIPHYKDIIQVC